tara:strand:- start:1235 stop:1624 length:390 start_codon:yes stop_codon:yes gene_type:complete
MPRKIVDKLKNIYIANINNKYEYEYFFTLFEHSDFILTNLLFELSHISKSTYIFDLFVFSDVNYNLTSSLLIEIKENILNEKGEIWIFCDKKNLDNVDKVTYINNILNTTNYRSSTIKFSDEFTLIVIK